jgi:hypothetical protein
MYNFKIVIASQANNICEYRNTKKKILYWNFNNFIQHGLSLFVSAVFIY